MVGTGRSAKMGVLTSGQPFKKCKRFKLRFDKTGTITSWPTTCNRCCREMKRVSGHWLLVLKLFRTSTKPKWVLSQAEEKGLVLSPVEKLPSDWRKGVQGQIDQQLGDLGNRTSWRDKDGIRSWKRMVELQRAGQNSDHSWLWWQVIGLMLFVMPSAAQRSDQSSKNGLENGRWG